ncbi:hypothetical protein MSAR_18120 [Mycolicibacterium sarraceniae]|uniref:Short-chain dehydrogenase n=1 Tax=Mycolicibacterium sarraceniae TaxID=1534348 RepID=A0A7I7SS84_9MYCO|nr:hypothetical protein MSAR_18120 [Mycolicibacterium sarraceniae]
MAGLLADKVAVVTGAGAGIGAAIARAYAAEGARVLVSDIDPGRADALSAEIPNSIAVVADVRDEHQVKNMVATTVESFGGIDIVVPNAGIATTVPLAQTSYRQWRDLLDFLDHGFRVDR